MASTKAQVIADWAHANGRALLRFDYSAHGRSPGNLLEASIGDWLEEALAIIDLVRDRRLVVVGSSMGGWIALLLARSLAERGEGERIAGMVLIAPAWDMTERLMWQEMSPEIRSTLETDGVYYAPSLYGDPYPITRHFIEEGRAHLIGDGPIPIGAPVRILQGMRDPDVPWRHALELVDLLASEDVTLTLIKDGDHRLSRPEDLERLTRTVADLFETVR
jgi:alpha-beta hydrolase superfamily lysophospholipase